MLEDSVFWALYCELHAVFGVGVCCVVFSRLQDGGVKPHFLATRCWRVHFFAVPPPTPLLQCSDWQPGIVLPLVFSTRSPMNHLAYSALELHACARLSLMKAQLGLWTVPHPSSQVTNARFLTLVVISAPRKSQEPHARKPMQFRCFSHCQLPGQSYHHDNSSRST